MEPEQFAVILPYISADLIDMIIKKQNLIENDAIRKLYASQLYAMLEKEETKVWYYSTPMLYSLLEEEEHSGTIHFPDV